MKRLIYVHGTNGSGKSTLARQVITAAGGVKEYRVSRSGKEGKAGSTHTPRGVYLLGSYLRACGGVDGFSPYAHVHHELIKHAIFPQTKVFAEGLLTPGVETCQKFAEYFDGDAHFIVLNTPPDECVRNVLARRARKANDKVYVPDKLHDKHRSALRWGDRLERVGLTVHRLKFAQAYNTILRLFELQPPTVEELLA